MWNAIKLLSTDCIYDVLFVFSVSEEQSNVFWSRMLWKQNSH